MRGWTPPRRDAGRPPFAAAAPAAAIADTRTPIGFDTTTLKYKVERLDIPPYRLRFTFGSQADRSESGAKHEPHNLT